MIMVGHSAIDENGRVSGGKAGDQNGKEVCSRAYWKHAKGWIGLRPKDKATAESIAKCMEDCIANPNVGYDQSERLTLYHTVKALNFKCDIKSLTTPVESDCSSLVRVCLAYAGIHVKDFTTANEKDVILATNKFEEIVVKSNGSNLKRGDILVTKTKGHSVVVLTTPETEVKKVNIEMEQLAKGSKGKQVKTLQILLVGNGFTVGKYGCDGDFGKDTDTAVRKYQKSKGLSVDGIVGKNTWTSLLK